MAESRFLLRVSNRTFEHFSGHGYVDAGGSPEKAIPLNDFWSLHLSVAEYIYDENGQIIGVRFRDRESGKLHDVFPGKVYNIDVWTTAVDDDGCPEDICISFYLELIPHSE
jgi:hypothetical protein